MGTRSLTTFINDHNHKEIVVLYRQYDGYPEGHGKELAMFLNGMRVVNGITAGDRSIKTANGIDCLAAQVVKHFKEGTGGFYLHRADTRDCGEEYIYTIYLKDKEINIEVRDVYQETVIFDGSVSEMDKWVDKEEDENFIPEHNMSKRIGSMLDDMSKVKQKEDGFTD